MTLIFYSASNRWLDWATHLQRELPTVPIRNWEQPGDDRRVRFALVWNPPAGELKRRFPNLEYIFSLGAGVDAILDDPNLPENVPVVRMVEKALVVGMTEYVTLHVLRLHRQQRNLEAQQRAKVWQQITTPLASNRRVGFMGLGFFFNPHQAKTMICFQNESISWCS